MSGAEAAYDWRSLPPATRPYAEVIGDPISQSKSPKIHGFWLEKLEIAADYRAAHVLPGDLAEYLKARRADAHWRGCNVTMPHKQAVMGLMNRLDDVATRIGAVNTVVADEGGGLTGHNTDAYGFSEPLLFEHGFHFTTEKSVLVIGNGGAARAVVAELAQRHVALTLAVRAREKGLKLLMELAPGISHAVADLLTIANPAEVKAARYDLVVNTSPLGMVGNPPLALDLSWVAPRGIVYDIVTAPLETELLKAAREAEFATIDGLSMLIGQARGAFHLFFGRPPQYEWDAELRRILTA